MQARNRALRHPRRMPRCATRLPIMTAKSAGPTSIAALIQRVGVFRVISCAARWGPRTVRCRQLAKSLASKAIRPENSGSLSERG